MFNIKAFFKQYVILEQQISQTNQGENMQG